MSAPPLTFRKATPADTPALLALVKSAYRGEDSRQGWTTEADFLADERIDEAGLLGKITAPGSTVLLATTTTTTTTSPPSNAPIPGAGAAAAAAETLLACCEVLRHPPPSDLSYFGLFAVDPRLQNGGIGRRVLAEAERHARGDMGAARMEMTVVWLREELIAWYVRRGYAVARGEKRPFPYGSLVNGKALRDDLYFLVLRKDLA
ncbi:putative acetyltransferase [Diaporthe ampelina]|uniref:Putative acetyltransferase n=1 Tax=Diaporthe ampelina TaxID=1214573 RepID=A0A0G2HT36_9PEZI|nr:putative acetyltransferase [Diaporthe ampelina]